MNSRHIIASFSVRNDQNFYHLASIQGVSIGPSAFIIGKYLSHNLGTGVAICSIFLGNVMLWLVGMAVISMVRKKRLNAVQNVQEYIGKFGSLLFALTLTASFLGWYALEINGSLMSLNSLLKLSGFEAPALSVRLSAILGVLSALLAIGGIQLLRRVAVISFPLVVLYSIYIIVTGIPNALLSWKWGISFGGIITVVLLLLPGVINLPTFFRHSQSRRDSYLALSLMTLTITFFECTSIWMPYTPDGEFLANQPLSNILKFSTILFLILSVTCSNLMNIYLASACYETFVPRFQGNKGHAIMGLLGTSVCVFIQMSPPVEFIENILTNGIVLIGIVLAMAYLFRLMIHHRPKKFERVINTASWIVGCAVATVIQFQRPDETIQALLHGMSASLLFFLLIFFFEETFWAIKKVRQAAKSD